MSITKPQAVGLHGTHRFPLGPLIDARRASIEQAAAGKCINTHGADMTFSGVADVFGVNRRTVTRWDKAGLTYLAADRAAVSIGQHPCMIWGDWWEVTEREMA